MAQVSSALEITANEAIAKISAPALTVQAQIAQIFRAIAGREYKDPAAAAEAAAMIRDSVDVCAKLIRDFDFQGARREAEKLWYQANPLSNRAAPQAGFGPEEAATRLHSRGWHAVEVEYVMRHLLAGGARAVEFDEHGITISRSGKSERYSRERIRHDSRPVSFTNERAWFAQFPEMPRAGA